MPRKRRSEEVTRSHDFVATTMSRLSLLVCLGTAASALLLFVGSAFTMTNGDRLDERARCEAAELSGMGATLPTPYYLSDDVQYFPHGEEFRLARDQALAREKIPGLVNAWRWAKSVLQRAASACPSITEP